VRASKVPYHLVEFVKLHPQVEGVIQHVGLQTWDLLLVDVTGLWDREEFATEAAARAACRTGSVETVPKRVSSRVVRLVVTRRATTVRMIAPRRITATLMRSGQPSVESSTRER